MTFNAESLLTLFSRERTRVVRLIQRIVGCRDTAEDLAQEAFLNVMGKNEQSSSYLFRTAQNLALDYLRAQKVRARHTEQTLLEASEYGEETTEKGLLDTEKLEQHMAALQSLPERTQRIFLMNRLDGLSYAEIANLLHVSISTVEKDMIKALQVCVRMNNDD